MKNHLTLEVGQVYLEDNGPQLPTRMTIIGVDPRFIRYTSSDQPRHLTNFRTKRNRFEGLIRAKVFSLQPPQKKFVETPAMKLKSENIELRRLVLWMLDMRTRGHGPAKWDDAAREVLGL